MRLVTSSITSDINNPLKAPKTQTYIDFEFHKAKVQSLHYPFAWKWLLIKFFKIDEKGMDTHQKRLIVHLY